jgi:hypothetical protein
MRYDIDWAADVDPGADIGLGKLEFRPTGQVHDVVKATRREVVQAYDHLAPGYQHVAQM